MTRAPVVNGTLALVLAASAFQLADARPHGAATSPLVASTEREVEVADGAELRLARAIAATAPRGAKQAWDGFVARHGSWEAVWDADTGVPLRVFGEGIAIPGANASPTIAADAAWRLLQEQLALVAPGARLDDFALVANTAHGGLRGSLPMRTVAFAQHHDGAPVLGASVGFLFKNDRMFVISSTAAPRLPGSTPRTSVGASIRGRCGLRAGTR